MVSLGEELKREREFREITLREISDATKINLRILEAIEKDDYSLLPGGVFNRNFVRAYAEFIGLDPEIAVRKYLVQVTEAPERAAPLNISVIGTKKPTILGIKRSWFYFMLAILVIAVAGSLLWFYRDKLAQLGTTDGVRSSALVYTT
jgi:cytoskeletal protein RodZ